MWLQRAPDDAAARIQLLSYYTSVPKGMELGEIRESRARHILWIVEHDPSAGLGLFQVGTGVHHLNCTGDELADLAAFEQVRAHPADAQIRREAVAALEYCAPEQAETILKEAHDEGGLGGLYGIAALGITGEEYESKEPRSTDAKLRQTAFAQKAVEALETTASRDVLVPAARTLLWEGALLWSEGKLDWDYTTLGNKVLARAKAAAGPEDLRLLTLPTGLPKRGERPAATLRVGGNAMSKMATRKVGPHYPADARRQGIQGSVILTALVGLDGKILGLNVIGAAELIPATVESVRRWEYKPTLLSGRPCYVVTQIKVDYTLSQ